MQPAGRALFGGPEFVDERADDNGVTRERFGFGADLASCLANLTKRKELVYQRSFFFGGGGNILFPVGAYNQLKTLFDELNKRDNHTITLKMLDTAAK